MDTMKILARRVYELRHTQGRKITQRGMARDCGMSVTTVNRIETGALNTVSIAHLVTLADYFGVTTDYLLGRTDEIDATSQPSAA